MDSPAVTLRPIAPEDLSILFEHQRDPIAVRMAAFPSRDREAFDAHYRKILADPSLVVRAVLADGSLVGNAVVFGRGGVREVGYWIAREHWGRGIASRALALLLAEVSERPLHARVAEHNAGSMRVLEKAGFREVGREIGDPADTGEAIVDVLYVLEEEKA